MSAPKQKIEEVEDDIINGKPCDDCHCPVARAIKRAFPGEDISVGTDWVNIGVRRYDLPPEAVNFISRFDHTRNPGVSPALEPFSFEL